MDDQPVGGGAKLNERKEEIAKKSGKAEVSTSKEQKVSKSEAFSFLRVADFCLLLATKVSKDDIGNTKESKTYSQRLEDVPKVTVEKSRATIPDKRSGKCKNEEKQRVVDDPSETKRDTENTDSMNDQMESTAKDTSTKSANPSKSTDLKSPFRTSTPRCVEASEQDDLTGKEATAATERNISASNSSARRTASTNNCSARDACVTKDLNNNNNNAAAKKDESKQKRVKCKHKRTEKTKKKKKPGSNKTSDISRKTASRCKKHDKDTTTAGKPVIVFVFTFDRATLSLRRCRIIDCLHDRDEADRKREAFAETTPKTLQRKDTTDRKKSRSGHGNVYSSRHTYN